LSLTDLVTSNLGSILTGTVLGVVLASAIQVLRDASEGRRKRNQTAGILGYEIASIKLLSEQSRLVTPPGIEVVKGEVQIYKEAMTRFQQGANVDVLLKATPITIGDIDLPRTIYDKPTIDLTLFTPELAATISELYRWVDFSNHVKKEANERTVRLRNLMGSRGGRISSVQDWQDAMFLQDSFVIMAEGYMKDLERIAQLAKSALKEINGIVTIDESRVLGDSFPTFAPHGETSK
jgi:hypothetical protein